MAAKKLVKKTSKKVSKKVANKVAKRVAGKVAKKTVKQAAQSASATVRVVSITPARDGAMWKLTLSDRRTITVPADAAQSAKIKIGATWTARVATRIQDATQDLAAFQQALKLLGSGTRLSYDALVAKLGGDARARRTVADLVAAGWVE
ncbi:MAG: hypothetical protein QM516_13890 [Limnohabitans sp.]|jgi:hypothetical protein|nr:hypothetical protein [Limnohabitans sp.]